MQEEVLGRGGVDSCLESDSEAEVWDGALGEEKCPRTVGRHFHVEVTADEPIVEFSGIGMDPGRFRLDERA